MPLKISKQKTDIVHLVSTLMDKPAAVSVYQKESRRRE